MNHGLRATTLVTRRHVGLLAAALAASGGAQAAEPAVRSQAIAPIPTAPWTGEGYVQRGGVRIHYATAGNGPPLVLLHKLGGWLSDWRHVAPAMAAKYRVIAMDMPGHGESTVQGPVPYLQTLPESAALILAALDELNVTRFDLIGNRDTVAAPDQPREIGVGGVGRDAAHGNLRALFLIARGQGNLQFARAHNGVFKKHLVEVAKTEENQSVGMLFLDGGVLPHQRRGLFIHCEKYS